MTRARRVATLAVAMALLSSGCGDGRGNATPADTNVEERATHVLESAAPEAAANHPLDAGLQSLELSLPNEAPPDTAPVPEAAAVPQAASVPEAVATTTSTTTSTTEAPPPTTTTTVTPPTKESPAEPVEIEIDLSDLDDLLGELEIGFGEMEEGMQQEEGNLSP